MPREHLNRAIRIAESVPSTASALDAAAAIDLPSRASQQLLGQVRLLARHAVIPVCIVGPSGTGKSLYAREIHRLSPLRDGPNVYLNLAAVPKGLVASELRGHHRGAFTGAVDRRAGRVLSASGGTLVLDEVTKAPRRAQNDLLQLLDRTPFTPVGTDREVIVNARFVTLSSVPLREAVRAGDLIPDLYERLKPFVVVSAYPSGRHEKLDLGGENGGDIGGTVNFGTAGTAGAYASG